MAATPQIVFDSDNLQQCNCKRDAGFIIEGVIDEFGKKCLVINCAAEPGLYSSPEAYDNAVDYWNCLGAT